MLIDLYSDPGMWRLPYDLLAERERHENISHREMPTWEDHCAYVRSKPYPVWSYFATDQGIPAGCIYLTDRREIGVGVLKAYRGRGLAKRAIKALMEQNPGQVLANINPQNTTSTRLFHSIGFRFLQVTYCHD